MPHTSHTPHSTTSRGHTETTFRQISPHHAAPCGIYIRPILDSGVRKLIFDPRWVVRCSMCPDKAYGGRRKCRYELMSRIKTLDCLRTGVDKRFVCAASTKKTVATRKISFSAVTQRTISNIPCTPTAPSYRVISANLRRVPWPVQCQTLLPAHYPTATMMTAKIRLCGDVSQG